MAAKTYSGHLEMIGNATINNKGMRLNYALKISRPTSDR